MGHTWKEKRTFARISGLLAALHEHETKLSTERKSLVDCEKAVEHSRGLIEWLQVELQVPGNSIAKLYKDRLYAVSLNQLKRFREDLEENLEDVEWHKGEVTRLEAHVASCNAELEKLRASFAPS